MTHHTDTPRAGDATAEAGSAPPASDGPRLPTVAVVIVTWNYARFLDAAIRSVFAQTYPHIDCVVVDNGSADDTPAVLAEAGRRHPGLKVIAVPANEGQTAACLRGFAATRGPYVIFLDADDTLLPHAVATHMGVHLATREHVGFTSGDMLQVVDDEIVVSTSDALNHAHKAGPANTALLRPDVAALEPIRRLAPPGLETKVRLIEPAQARWVWAPTSGNCFRRDALALFFDGEGLGALTSQTDLLLALAVNAVSGSILIDEPVFAYRLHGANTFTSRPQLRGVLSFDTRLSGGPAELAKALILDQMTRHVERFVPERWRGKGFFRHLARLDGPDETGRSRAARHVAERFEAVAAAAGRPRTLLFLLRRGWAWAELARLLASRSPRA